MGMMTQQPQMMNPMFNPAMGGGMNPFMTNSGMMAPNAGMMNPMMQQNQQFNPMMMQPQYNQQQFAT